MFDLAIIMNRSIFAFDYSSIELKDVISDLIMRINAFTIIV